MSWKSFKIDIWPILIGILLFGLSTYKLESIPPLWWDEGWTLNVAKNWVEKGHYGQLIEGEPRSPGLSGHFPTVATVAISFKLCGIGVWQARLPFVLYGLGVFGLLFFIARKRYNPAIAWGTVGVLFLMTGGLISPPILEARQVVGELPSIFFLLIGYVLLNYAFPESKWFILLAAIFWGIALRTKAQILPFWLVSIILPILLSLYKRQWNSGLWLGAGLLGSWVVYKLLGKLQGVLIGDQFPNEIIPGLLNVTAVVPNLNIRLMALKVILVMGLPLLFGLIYATRKSILPLFTDVSINAWEISDLALWGFVSSWLAWYILLGMWWPRYLFTPLVVGSIFVSTLLYDLFSGLKFRKSSNLELASDHRKHRLQTALGFLLALILVSTTIPFTIMGYVRAFSSKDGLAYAEVVEFLNNETPQNAVIETYESELFFQLDRSYHYPPDPLSIDFIRRREFDEDISVSYDPLIADPDYIVIGLFGRLWKLYDEVVKTEDFRLARDFSFYQVYERVR